MELGPFYLVPAILLLSVNGKRHSKRQAVTFDNEDVRSANDCRTPTGAEGSCVRLVDCQPYYSKFQTGNTSPDFYDLLKRSHCRYEGRVPIVCCPDVVVHSPVSSAPVTSLPITTVHVTSLPITTVHVTSLPITTVHVPSIPVTVPTPPDANLILPRSCGVTSGDKLRIIGGRPAKKGSWPWIAALGYSGFRGRLDFLCGGALITNQHILTAAHCIHNRLDLSVVRLGAHDLKNDPASSYVDRGISKRIPHENYNPISFQNDIAIVTLDSPVNFKAGMSAACLPTASFFRNNQLASLQGFIAGWGATNFNGPASSVLLEAIVPIKTNDECKQSYASFRSIVIDGRTLCAGSGDTDTCQGDSGGPLMVFDPTKSTFNVAGVVSVGYKCAEKGFPGIYTRITSYLDWINNNLQ